MSNSQEIWSDSEGNHYLKLIFKEPLDKNHITATHNINYHWSIMRLKAKVDIANFIAENIRQKGERIATVRKTVLASLSNPILYELIDEGDTYTGAIFQAKENHVEQIYDL